MFMLCQYHMCTCDLIDWKYMLNVQVIKPYHCKEHFEQLLQLVQAQRQVFPVIQKVFEPYPVNLSFKVTDEMCTHAATGSLLRMRTLKLCMKNTCIQ